VISGIVGSGIFINPYFVAQIAQTPFLILLTWAIGGAIALVGAFVFAELSTVMPRAGGQYAFFREAFHPLVAFLHGWSLLLIIESGATAVVAVTFGEYVSRLFALPAELVIPLAVVTMMVLSCFHALGIKPGAMLLNVITLGKILALGALIVGALAFAPGAAPIVQPLVPPGLSGLPLLSVIFGGLAPVMFSYGGWQNLNFVSEEVRDPLYSLPRAILIGVACVIAIYLGANVAYLRVLSAPVLAATRTPAADMAAAIGGPRGAAVISALIVVSTFGFLNLTLLSAPRVYYAMAADGLFFSSVARISPRFHVPTVAILLQGALASFFAVVRSYKPSAYQQLVNYAVFADWIFFALAGAALIVFRSKLPDAPRTIRVPLYPWTPLLFCAAGIGIVLNMYFADPWNAAIGTTVVLMGVPAYFFWRRMTGR
jgi:APA family basic amino acid/polyamine antiporter